MERQEGHIPWVPMQYLRPIAESMGRFIDRLEVENPDLASRLRSIHDNALETLASPPSPKNTGISTTAPWFLYSPPGAEGNHDANENPR